MISIRILLSLSIVLCSAAWADCIYVHVNSQTDIDNSALHSEESQIDYNLSRLFHNTTYDFSLLENFSHLNALSITSSTRKSPIYDSYKTLPLLPHLESLDFSNRDCTTPLFMPLEELVADDFFQRTPALKKLTLKGWEMIMNMPFIAYLGTLPHLEELSLDGPTHNSFLFNISQSSISLQPLASLKKLTIYSHEQFYYSNDSFYHEVCSLANLQELTALNIGLPSHFLQNYTMPSLTHLTLGNCTLDFNFASFAPRLKMLRIDWSRPTNLNHLNGFGSLEELYFHGVTLDENAPLVFETFVLPQLKKITMTETNARKLPFHLFAPNLIEIDLHNTTITGGEVVSLSKLQNLEKVDLSSTSITSGAIQNLSKIKTVKSMVLNDTNLTGAAFAKLKASPQLEELYLTGQRFGKSDLSELGKIKQLKLLDLRNPLNPYLTEEDYNILQEALPNTKILR